MNLNSKDHYEMMEFFERQFPHFRLEHEPKEIWARGNIYQSGEANAAFIAFRAGVAYGQAIER